MWHHSRIVFTEAPNASNLPPLGRLTVLLLASLCGLSPTRALSAQSDPASHHHPESGLIDGAVHPELIPDLTAYRLYFVAVSRPPAPSDNEIKHQAAQLSKIGLQDTDRGIVIDILASFNSRYHDLIKDYNEVATAAWNRGEHPDAASLSAERDRLVQSTCDGLKAALSPDGWTRLDSHVKSEKQKMKISAREAGQ